MDKSSVNLLSKCSGNYCKFHFCAKRLKQGNLKKHTDRQAVVMLPLWLAPWLLLIILIDWMSIRIFSLWWMVDSSGIPSVDGSYQSYFMRNIVYHFYNSLAYMPAGVNGS